VEVKPTVPSARGGPLGLRAMIGLVGGTMGSPRTAPIVEGSLRLLPSLTTSAVEAEGAPQEREKERERGGGAMRNGTRLD
jgi:hypothetical protein